MHVSTTSAVVSTLRTLYNLVRNFPILTTLITDAMTSMNLSRTHDLGEIHRRVLVTAVTAFFGRQLIWPPIYV